MRVDLVKKFAMPARTLTGHISRRDEHHIEFAKMGPKPLISIEMQEVILDVLVRMDRANEGVGIAEALEIVAEICPELSSDQISNALFHLRRKNPEFIARLTKKPVAAQATTTKRTAITPESQFRWHTVYIHTIFDNIFSWTL